MKHDFSRRLKPHIKRCAIFILAMASMGGCQNTFAETPGKNQIVLKRAVTCESVHELSPVNTAITFSITNGQVVCYTEFIDISEETFVFHRWYRYDTLVTEKKLLLKPPRWSTYSSIQLRESDKGPWRITIVGADGQILEILRFSVTE